MISNVTKEIEKQSNFFENHRHTTAHFRTRELISCLTILFCTYLDYDLLSFTYTMKLSISNVDK